MKTNIAYYQERLHLQDAHFTLVEHEDAMVATVFKIKRPTGEELILKICSRPGDYVREVYFLTHFQGKVPVPHVMQVVPPGDVDGAILMECLPGHLLNKASLAPPLCHEIGALLARIHLDAIKGHGDLTKPDQLSSDPRVPFSEKFQEEFDECRSHLPKTLLAHVLRYYEEHIDLLLATDGPCIIHRDFRPGNVFANHGKVRGIIDWSSARGGFAEEDFIPFALGEWSNNPADQNAFLAGYDSVRKVPNYQRILPLLRLSKAIGAIGFTVKQDIWQGKAARLYQLHRRSLESFFK